MTKKYDQLHSDLVDMLANNGMHSTLVGKVVTLGGKVESDRQAAEELATYIVEMAKKAKDFRKGNVKKAKN